MWLCSSCIYGIIDMNAKMYRLIIKYKEYGHYAFMLEPLLDLMFEFEYDFVRGWSRYKEGWLLSDDYVQVTSVSWEILSGKWFLY